MIAAFVGVRLQINHESIQLQAFQIPYLRHCHHHTDSIERLMCLRPLLIRPLLIFCRRHRVSGMSASIVTDVGVDACHRVAESNQRAERVAEREREAWGPYDGNS